MKGFNCSSNQKVKGQITEYVYSDEDIHLNWPYLRIDVERAWEKAKGDDVIVAVIDTGFDLDSMDYSDKVIDTYNSFTGTSWINSKDYHGTFTSSIACAQPLNGYGIDGVGYNCKLMLIQAFDTNRSSTSFHLSKALYYAVEKGADVINNSWCSGS